MKFDLRTMAGDSNAIDSDGISSSSSCNSDDERMVNGIPITKSMLTNAMNFYVYGDSPIVNG